MNLKKYRTSIILAFTFAFLISAFWFMPNLAFVVFLSILLELLLSPLVDKAQKRMPRPLAAGIVLFFFVALAGTMLAIISGTVVPSFQEFMEDFPRLAQKLQNITIFGHKLGIMQETESLWQSIIETGSTALKSTFFILLSLFGKFVDMVIIIFVAFYLLADGEKIKSYIVNLFPNKDSLRISALFNSILTALRAYISSQLVICLITGIIVFLYFTLRGIPYAPVFGLISGIAEFVPVLGPTVASILGTALTATQNPMLALQTLLFYGVLTQVNHNVIYPNLIGKTLNLHPVAIILGIILGGEIRGVGGMFLAVPIIVIVKLVIEDQCRSLRSQTPNP